MSTKHLNLMIKTMKESENKDTMLEIMERLATMLVDADFEFLQGAKYNREFKHNALTIKVIHDKDKR